MPPNGRKAWSSRSRKDKQEARLPILRGRVVGTQIFVHCPYCDQDHIHGWAPGERKPTHRAAHCVNPQGPWREGGYYVAPLPRVNSFNSGR
jgi:hypothetical protein